MLTGLLHEVGKLPILARLAEHADLQNDQGMRSDIVAGLHVEVTVATLNNWGLPASIVDAAQQQDDWSYDHDGPCDLTDVLLVAHIHARQERREVDGVIDSGGRREMPRLDETPAFAKITGKPLRPQESLALNKRGQVVHR